MFFTNPISFKHGSPHHNLKLTKPGRGAGDGLVERRVPRAGLAVADHDGLVRSASRLVEIEGEIPHLRRQTQPESDVLEVGEVVDPQFEERGSLILEVGVEGEDVGPGLGAVAAAGEEGGHP